MKILITINIFLCLLLGSSCERNPPQIQNKPVVKNEIPQQFPKILYIQIFGSKLSKKLIQESKQTLRLFYGFKIKTLPSKSLPKIAYYPPRKRYRADKLLDYLLTILPNDGDYIVGLSSVDISTTKGKYKDWGVIGLATLEGKSSMVSTFRCRLRSRSRKQAKYRFLKALVHEVGHNLGLDHCPNKGCIMMDAKGTSRTIDKEYTFCSECIELLEEDGFTISDSILPPWPKPSNG